MYVWIKKPFLCNLGLDVQIGCLCPGSRRRQWQPTPVLLPGKSHGQRSLVGCSPWGREESDTTERLCFHFSLSCIGEENGNPHQYSCLENPRDGGAQWAAIYGVTQSWTWLKWLSSSSSSPGSECLTLLTCAFRLNCVVEKRLAFPLCCLSNMFLIILSMAHPTM